MKQIKFSELFIKKLAKLKCKDKQLSLKIQKQLKSFHINPKHPSLRVHKLKGQLKDTWSISVTENFRLIYTNRKNNYYFFDLGTHEEVYR